MEGLRDSLLLMHERVTTVCFCLFMRVRRLNDPASAYLSVRDDVCYSSRFFSKRVIEPLP